MIVIDKWAGLVTNAGPYAIPPGAAVTQVNLQVLNPGQLTVRAGLTAASFVSATQTAASLLAGTRPATVFRDRREWMYAVNGGGRGVRLAAGTYASVAIGLKAPTSGLAVTTSSSAVAGRVTAIQVIDPGAGYSSAPAVVLTGGTPTKAASARASIFNGRVNAVTVVDPGSGYKAAPSISLASGMATSAAFSVGVLGAVDDIEIVNPGSGYSSTPGSFPTIVFSSAQGLVDAQAVADVDDVGRITGVRVLAAGTGATTTGVTASVTGGGGTGVVLKVQMDYRVAAVTVANSGSGYSVPPALTFRPALGDLYGQGASAEATASTAGNVSGVTLIAGGAYSAPPTCVVLDSTAKAQASIATPLRGKYQCCVRYTDDTAEKLGGPIPSSISDLVAMDCGDGVGAVAWTLPTGSKDSRATHVELWRTTADQSVVLFRVARLAASATAYTDSLSDAELQDTKRTDYGLMPVTLPSGQINARRFGVPPEEFAFACMFQDRAWYAVDTSGARPNALLYSEIDEPESVPPENELLLQENVAEKDEIVALVPLASQLLVVQRNHLYKLTYVAQPVIDASFQLGAHRGVLHSRCLDILSGVVFLVDSQGMYAYDGSSVEPVSIPVDNYWRDRVIDFTKADKFHVHADTISMTVRFYYCQSGDSAPTRALCFCVPTKAWWEETYPHAVVAAANTTVSGRREEVVNANNQWLSRSGQTDYGTDISYSLRTGPMALVDERGDRSVTVLYKPTTSAATLNLQLHYNGSAQARANAIVSDRGGGFASDGTQATLDMRASRSALGDATGLARAYYSGRADDRSSGGDRHIAVALSGTKPSSEGVTLYGVSVAGVTS